MKIKKEALTKALTLVKPGLANKEIIEQSTSFVFTKGSVRTFNDEISISHPVKDLDLEGAVNADEFYRFISKVKRDEIEIELKENQLYFTAARTKAGLTLQEEITLPLESIGKKGNWKHLPDDFSYYLSLAIGACSNDMSRPILTCVNITQEGKIIGSDSYCLMTCEIGEKIPIDDFLLPASSALEVLKIQPTQIAEGDGWVHFRNKDKTEISCRTFEDSYPDTSAYETVEGVELTFPKSMLQKLELARVFAKRDHILDEEVIITVRNNRMTIKAKSETGWIEDEANMRYDDDPVRFSITPYLLEDILKGTHDFVLSENAAMFSGAGWKYITMLRILQE